MKLEQAIRILSVAIMIGLDKMNISEKDKRSILKLLKKRIRND